MVSEVGLPQFHALGKPILTHWHEVEESLLRVQGRQCVGMDKPAAFPQGIPHEVAQWLLGRQFILSGVDFLSGEASVGQHPTHELPGVCRRDGLVEKRPDMGTLSRLRHLHQWHNPTLVISSTKLLSLYQCLVVTAVGM